MILLTSCSKSDSDKKDVQKCDCSRYLPSTESVYCEGVLSENDTCQTYFTIWKALFLTGNNMPEEYFNTHITPCVTNISKVNDGILFDIYYKVDLAWLEVRLYDRFIIWLSPATTTGVYPTLNIPRNELLTKEQIRILMANNAFGSKITGVSPITNLKYASRSEAMNALISASKVDTLCSGSIFYGTLDPKGSSNGHPYIEASATLNWYENKCIHSQMDLVTGEVNVNYEDCIIVNK